MGRLLVFFGLILTLVGGAGATIAPMLGFMNFNPGAIVDQVNDIECAAGERLVNETGASVYTAGQGYAASVRYFCVNSAGERREMTAQLADNIFSSVTGIFDGIMPGFSNMMLFMLLVPVGIVMMLVGAAIRRRNTPLQPQVAPMFTASNRTSAHNSPIQSDRGSASFFGVNTTSSSSAGASGSDNLTERLEQLEELKRRRLITDEEYQQMRDRIIKSL